MRTRRTALRWTGSNHKADAECVSVEVGVACQDTRRYFGACGPFPVNQTAAAGFDHQALAEELCPRGADDVNCALLPLCTEGSSTPVCRAEGSRTPVCRAGRCRLE